MTKEEKAKISRQDSRIWKTLLFLLAALLTFGGPTYAMYVLTRAEISYPYVTVFGFSLFLVGIILFMYLFRKGGVAERT